MLASSATRRYEVALAAATSFWLLAASPARAADCDNPLVNTCINSDSYWPNPGPMRFAAVSTTETVARGQVGFGLVTSYHSRPIILHVASPGPGGSDQYVVDNQVNGNFLFAYGVTDRLELDFALPATFVQSGAGTSPLTGGRALRDTAVRDVRFGFAYALVPRARGGPEAAGDDGQAVRPWALAARFQTTAPTGDRSDFAGERTGVFVPSLAADYRHERVFFGAEIGARLRPITEFAGARIGPQLTTALGAGVDVLDRQRLSVLLEGRAYWNFAEQHESRQSAFGLSSEPRRTDATITPAEWMLGLRSAPVLAGDISFYLGGGGPIPIGPDAITVPRYRFVLGVVYAPMQVDSDGDGVPDKLDACPRQRGPRGGERPGCPTQEERKP